MTKHTPGPWRAYNLPMNPWWHVIAEGTINRDVADVEGPGSAVIFNNPHQLSAVEADAKLIAASPDLLAALKMALEWGRWDIGSNTASDPAWVGVARAAIAKATAK